MRSRWWGTSLILCLGCRGGAMSPWLLSEPPESVHSPAPAVLASRSREIDANVAEPVDTLGLAAEAMRTGQSQAAADHLRRHVRENPDQIMIRAYLAELYQKQHADRDAEYHFTRFIESAQGGNPSVRDHTIHCHTRLMELAIGRGDDYQEHLQRGIGLYLLARKASLKSATVETEVVESMYGRAVAELTAATERDAADARGWWYLSRVWEELRQPQAVRRCLARARAGVGGSTMTASEKAALAEVPAGDRPPLR